MNLRPFNEVVTELLSTNLDQRQTALLVELVQVMSTASGGSRVESPDGDAAAKRREWDRERKRAKREAVRMSTGLSTRQCGIPPDFPVDTAEIDQKEVVINTLPLGKGKEETSEKKKQTKTSVVEGRDGTRLPKDIEFPADYREFARGEGFSEDAACNLWAEFVDYWIGLPGRRGRKLDWFATWRNWVRKARRDGRQRTGYGRGDPRPGPQQPHGDAVMAGMANYKEKRFGDELPEGGGWVSEGLDPATGYDPDGSSASGTGGLHPQFKLVAQSDGR